MVRRGYLVPLVLLLAAADVPALYDWSTTDLSYLGGDAQFRASRALCAAVITAEPPAADRPTKAEQAALKECDSEALYYGIGTPADSAKARKCAFVEADQIAADGYDRYSPFQGRAMLSVIYANGVGAQRNLDVSMHLACGLGDAAAEMDGRINRMGELKAKRWGGRDFTLCEDATSGFLGGQCVAHDKRFADIDRARRWSVLTKGWTAARRSDLKRLTALHEKFVDAHGDGEVDMSGTLRVAEYIGATDGLREEYFELLTGLDAGRIKPATTSAFRNADLRLNRAYRALMNDPDQWRWSEPSPQKSGYRATERAWIRYRDEMIAFAGKHYPATSRDGLAIMMTDARTSMLAID